MASDNSHYGDSLKVAPCRYEHLANRLKEAGMARIARVVVSDLPHQVTPRGNRREPVLFEADDHRLYRQLAAAAAQSGPIA